MFLSPSILDCQQIQNANTVNFMTLGYKSKFIPRDQNHINMRDWQKQIPWESIFRKLLHTMILRAQDDYVLPERPTAL